jgi:mRNA interferase MazF
LKGRPEGTLKRGDIVLVSFPFTNLSAKKVRPAIALSITERDILLAFISSVVSSEPLSDTDYLLSENHADFHTTGLKKTSIFKMNKLLTLDRSMILRRLGKVSEQIQKELDDRLKIAVGITP